MSMIFIDCRFFSILSSASRGPSAIAELLVVCAIVDLEKKIIHGTL